MHLYRRVDSSLPTRPQSNIRIILFSFATIVYTAFLYLSGTTFVYPYWIDFHYCLMLIIHIVCIA
jgi:hypothetical protein